MLNALLVVSSCALPSIALVASAEDLGIMPFVFFKVFVPLSRVFMPFFAVSGTAAFSFSLADSVAMSCA